MVNAPGAAATVCLSPVVRQSAARGFGTVRGGALYPVLGRLENDGLVGARWQAGEAGPGRKVHRLTDAGWARLREEREGWEHFSSSVDRLLARVDDVGRERT
ncbi:PadR family transcriptional regulator [Streptomyces javensis]|uniref:PadR family transcriptional regulator n=1 Tax=Streptomyces javensis TaxID=114698 RepID=UPI0033C2C55E